MSAPEVDTGPVRIAMWSGPRNLSTAMMRSFGNREDCAVADEPFYACFLRISGVEHPMREGAELRWTVEGGGRYQLDPFFALDIGVGRRMTGDDPAWFVTIGAARTFGIQSLIPIPGR